MSPQPRVAAVSYLNTAPLVWGMLHGPQKGLFELEFCTPAECADRIAGGAADIGIVPCIEVQRQGLEALPGTGIACRGAVRSILLIAQRRLERIRVLAADSTSRTSVMLARIVLARRYGVQPRFVSHAPDLEAMLAAADAALIIGDAALRLQSERLPYNVLDLGLEWLEMTGLPMVFAVWAGRRERLRPEWAEWFAGSCRYGLERIEEIVQTESAARGLPEDLVRRYFSENVVLELGEREYEGMRRYLEYAREFDIVSTAAGRDACRTGTPL